MDPKAEFRRAFTECGCVFKETTLAGLNQGNYFENATACRKRMCKTTVATQLYVTYKNIKKSILPEVSLF